MIQRSRAIAALGAVCLTFGCQQPQESDRQAPAAKKTPTAPALVIAEPPLDRQALLWEVARAASTTALGQTDQEGQRKLDGKRFEMRLRFGCEGPMDEDADKPQGWTFDKERRVLSLRFEPEISDKAMLSQTLETEGYEAVEGFWIHRPWILTAACPAKPASPAPEASASASPEAETQEPVVAETSPPAPRIGIARFFTEADARTHRRGTRAYTTTVSLNQNQAPSTDGYNLIVTGRLGKLADGRVIACKSDDASVPPNCIISAQFDSVAVEVPSTGEIIAKWSTA